MKSSDLNHPCFLKHICYTVNIFNFWKHPRNPKHAPMPAPQQSLPCPVTSPLRSMTNKKNQWLGRLCNPWLAVGQGRCGELWVLLHFMQRKWPTHDVVTGERMWEASDFHQPCDTIWVQRKEVRSENCLVRMCLQNFWCTTSKWTKCLNSQCSCWNSMQFCPSRGKQYFSGNCPHFWKQHLYPPTNIWSGWRAYTASKGEKGTSARKNGRSTLVERAILSRRNPVEFNWQWWSVSSGTLNTLSYVHL